jgi:hypothetical protein
MKYEKPELTVLGFASETIQSAVKGPLHNRRGRPSNGRGIRSGRVVESWSIRLRVLQLFRLPLRDR